MHVLCCNNIQINTFQSSLSFSHIVYVYVYILGVPTLEQEYLQNTHMDITQAAHTHTLKKSVFKIIYPQGGMKEGMKRGGGVVLNWKMKQ